MEGRWIRAAFPVEAALLSHTTPETRVTVARFGADVQGLKYDAVVLDITARDTASRTAWVRFIEDNAHLELVLIAYKLCDSVVGVTTLQDMRRRALSCAADVGGKESQAYASDDARLHAIRSRNRKEWDLLEFWPGLEQLDIGQAVSAVQADKRRISLDAQDLWVTESRETQLIKQLAHWAERRLRDDEVLLELKHGALSLLRAFYFPDWAAADQLADLHLAEEEGVRADGHDTYPEERRSLVTKVKSMKRILGATLSAAVSEGLPVEASAEDSAAAATRSRHLYISGGKAALFSVSKFSGTISKRMRGVTTTRKKDPAPAPTAAPARKKRKTGPTIGYIQTVLKKCGYVRAWGPQRALRDGKRIRLYGFAPVVPKGVPAPSTPQGDLRSGATPTSTQFSQMATASIYTAPLYRHGGHPAETARDSALNLTAGHTLPRGGDKMQVWLKPGWRELAIPAEYTADKKERAEKGAAWMRRTAKKGLAPAFHRDWESLMLTGGLFKSKGDSARVLTEATNIGRYFRGYVCAPEGQRFVNFDIQACHMRIARTLLRLVSNSPYFDAMFAEGDVYAAFGTRFNMNREQAKHASLILLNGGSDGEEGLCTVPGLDPTAISEILSMWKNNKNNPWLNARKKLVENYGQHLPKVHHKTGKPRGLNSYVALLMQERENAILQLTVKKMWATQGVPLFRWAIPMYDGSLFLCAEADAPRLTEIAKACAEEACRLHEVDPVVHANHGATWAEAEGK
jgi:hypothetical protein